MSPESPPNSGANEVALPALVLPLPRSKKGYYRPLTFHEWCTSTGCDLKPDRRSEYRKIRELIREGEWPKPRRLPPGQSGQNEKPHATGPAGKES